MNAVIDPVELTAALVRCPSVTPAEGGAISLLQDLLQAEGFACTRIERGGISNLFARWEASGPTFGFNGHTDVVPPGDPADWTVDPFGAVIRDGMLWGRGAADMKSAVAAFTVAAIEFSRQFPDRGSIVLTITGDEEKDARDGTAAILDWMDENGQRMDVCLVGEPTSRGEFGSAMKIGRRGSYLAAIRLDGVQGHSAYPELARNPVAAMARLVDRIASTGIDNGTADFDPSSVSVVTIETGNPASNVIPASCESVVNIRFNDAHDQDSLMAWLQSETGKVEKEFGVRAAINPTLTGDCFVTRPGPLTDLVAGAVEAQTGQPPELSTSGGTSDARFIRSHCPVVEFGLVGDTIHQVDERVCLNEIIALKEVYFRILDGYLD